MRPYQTFRVMEDLKHFVSGPFYRKGVELSVRDSQTTLEVYQQWLLLLVDLGYLSSDSITKTAKRLFIDIINKDILDLNNCFAECLQLVRLKTTKGFKALCRGISFHLFDLIKSDVNLISLGDVVAAKRLIQLFSYTSRLSLNDIDLQQQMLDDYMRVEADIPSVFPDKIIQALNKIIRRWFGPFGPTEFCPSHGPGGIAEEGRCSLQRKYELLSTDSLLEYSFGKDHWWCDGLNKLDRCSKVIFVPKSYKSFRTISMEPATLQYFQQGVWKEIEKLVISNSYLRNHIDFRDQVRNQRLAKEGSINRNYATIDLSSASDSVSYELVKKLFKGTWLYRYLISCRSRETLLPDGNRVLLKKFAPMGSALCFPVETIIFAAICEHVTRIRNISGKYSVYGDDIIVPTQCVVPLISILTCLGFSTNLSKSFTSQDCWFRESCGTEYCDGYDVTPLRISRTYSSDEPMIRVAKLIDLANSAYDKGFRNLRYFFLNKLKSYNFVPLFSPIELKSDNYTNYHTKKRWNKRLQRIECRVSGIQAKYSPSSLQKQDEEIRLRHWFESTRNRKSIGDGFESVISRPIAVLTVAWRFKPYELSDQQFIDESRNR